MVAPAAAATPAAEREELRVELRTPQGAVGSPTKDGNARAALVANHFLLRRAKPSLNNTLAHRAVHQKRARALRGLLVARTGAH